MKKLLPYLTFCLVSAFSFSNVSAQSCNTDASYLGGDNRARLITNASSTSQSFRALNSGTLRSVSLDMSASNSVCSLSDIQVELKIFDGDGLAGSVLTTETFSLPLNISQTYVDFNLSMHPTVTSGQLYTIDIVLTPGQDCGSGSEPNLVWYYSFPTNYWSNTGGTQYWGGVTPSLGNTQKFSTCVGCSYVSPTGNSNQTVCAGSTLSDLSVNGTTITWYADAVTTVPLAPNTTVTNGQTYYASNTESSCESPTRLDVTVTTIPTPDVSVSNSGYTITANASGAGYRWLDCNNNYSVISGETSQSYSPSSNGNYAVEITANGCTDTSACEAIVSLGISEKEFENTIHIYPNPSSEFVNIDLGVHNSIIDIQFISLDGKVLYSKSTSEVNVNIDLSSLPNGMLLIKITDGENIKFERMLKQ